MEPSFKELERNNFHNELLTTGKAKSLIEKQNKKFTNEEIKKFQSDSTSIVSDSSEGNECLTDSDSSLIRNNNSKNNLEKGLDVEFPSTLQRSKSQRFKKRYYIESDVVNEEQDEEDEADSKIKRKPFKYSYTSLNDDFPKGKNFKKSKFESFKTLMQNILPNMDPVAEVKEDEKDLNSQLKGLNLGINSPRIRLLTDIKEDQAINSSNLSNFSNFANNYYARGYSVETNEIIAEDNNENIIENDLVNKETLHKNMLEGIIDKEEILNIHELNVNCNSEFEPIKEENVLEEEDKESISFKRSENKKILKGDEVESDVNIASKSLLRHTHATKEEDPIIEDEVVDDEK